MTQHCGLVAVLGAPNAGKSTLVNALVGQKVAIVSAKAQTTRARLLERLDSGELDAVLPHVTLAIGNRDECEVAVGERDPERAADAIARLGLYRNAE